MNDTELRGKILRWMATGETGISSKKMAFTAVGEEYEKNYPSHPHDPADFNRCLMLLDAVPEIRDHLCADAGVV